MTTSRNTVPPIKGGKVLASSREPDAATLERMLYYLKLTREAEQRIDQVLYRQGKIVGGVYIGRGQEAIGVGSAIQLTDGDVVFPSHRDFSSFVIRGFRLPAIFANWMGRATGPTRGRENTTHIGDLKLGVIPIISPLGDTLPLACGVALAFRRRRQSNVVLVHFGEGTTSRGDVHEAMNMAAVMKLAVLFICNNNGYAYSTPPELQYAVKDLDVRGPAYGMPGKTIDGNDVVAVYAAVAEAIRLARSGGGPSFIECKTFRMTGHSAHDAAEYVPKRRFAQEAKRDPILRLEELLLSRKLIARQAIDEMEKGIRKEVDEAVAWADLQPMPRGEEAVEGVYCELDCWWNH